MHFFTKDKAETPPKDTTEVDEYNYSGRLTGKDIKVDSVLDSVLCFATETTIRDKTGTSPDAILKSNTCDLLGALNAATHEAWNNVIVGTDTTETVTRREYHVTAYLQIDWDKPVLDSTWIPELILTPSSSTKITWYQDKARINYGLPTLIDSTQVPGPIKGSVLFDYILRFNKKSI